MTSPAARFPWNSADLAPVAGMNRRASRYRVRAVSPGSYDETTPYSRREDALKRAKVMVQTWDSAAAVMVRDTYTGEDIFEHVREPAEPEAAPVVEAAPVPVPAAPPVAVLLTPAQFETLQRANGEAVALARLTKASERRAAGILALCVVIAAACVAVVTFGGPQANARPAPRQVQARCDRLATQGAHAWQVEAARLTAATGTRHTVGSLSAACSAG